MEQRRRQILYTIIKEHIRSGAPVGSRVLVDKYKLNISPATVRNEMAELEQAGLIKQPHTSAGRIPTEAAYRFYLENLARKKLPAAEEKILERLLKNKSEDSFKLTAKALAKLSRNAVFWAFHKRNLYYTGISNLLSQPEFAQANLIYDISAIIDHLDEIIDKIFDKLDYSSTILVGSQNPFGHFCSVVLAKYKLKDQQGLFGILGPIRMDYEKNSALVNHIYQDLVNKK